jgi:hypothetical protein
LQSHYASIGADIAMRSVNEGRVYEKF